MGRREGHVKMEAETKVSHTWGCHVVKEARDNSLPEPLEGGWPCLHLDFRLLVSRTLRE